MREAQKTEGTLRAATSGTTGVKEVAMSGPKARRRACPAQKVGVLRLYDRADGVKGHYCVGRLRKDGANEFWHTNKFCSAGEVFIDKEAAETKLRELSATEQEVHDALVWAIKFFQTIDSAGCSRKECERAREVAVILSGLAYSLKLDQALER